MNDKKPLRRVAPSGEMSDEVFYQHYNARHMPLAGLSKLHTHASSGAVASLRAYHTRVHDKGHEDDPPNRRDVNHYHRESE